MSMRAADHVTRCPFWYTGTRVEQDDGDGARHQPHPPWRVVGPAGRHLGDQAPLGQQAARQDDQDEEQDEEGQARSQPAHPRLAWPGTCPPGPPAMPTTRPPTKVSGKLAK